MDDSMSHAHNFSPGDFRMVSPKIIGNFSRGFANYLNQMS